MKCVSYNIQYGLGKDKRYDLARIAAEISAADVIALQEVDRFWQRSGMIDSPKILSEALPEYYYVYGANLDMDAKLITGITTTGLLAGMPILTNAQFVAPESSGDLLECKLISRADLSRAYLLMHNRTDKQIAAVRFDAQSIQFDHTILNMAEAYVEPLIIPSHDRVMVRLNLEAGLQKEKTAGRLIDMNTNTQYLSQGTRVVDLVVRIDKGVAIIDSQLIQAWC